MVLAGCTLYFDSPSGGDDGPWDQDAGPLPDSSDPPWTGQVARCEDGQLYSVPTSVDAPEQPGHGAGVTIGRCSGACRSAATICDDDTCSNAQDLCVAEPYVQGCYFDGTACSANQTAECPNATTCGYSVPGQTCVCSGGTYDCTARTPATTTQQKLVGKWRGTVTPPDFAEPYPVSLWIYPDGTYWAECDQFSYCTAFYYGGDGPHPERKIQILSTSATEGSWADIAIYFGGVGSNVGAISALTVNTTKLHFTYFASWFGCGQPFTFDLTRE